jgi:hypothetical protein
MSVSLSILCAASLLVSSVVATPEGNTTPANEYQALMNSAAPALITVKYVLKVQGPGGTRDIDREITAIMMDKSGLVLCAGVQIGTSRLMRRMGATTPTDIKILIGDDTVGIDANLIATDAELDLAWLRIKDATKIPADMKFIDFSKSKTLGLGDRVLTVNRMDKFFDRAAVISEGRVVGSTKKPRDMLVSGVGIDMEPGMAVFAADGSPAGVVVLQSPDPEDMEEGPSRGSMATLILSSEQLNQATKRALATAAEEQEEEDDSSTSAAKPESAEEE